ncbi:MAG: response regulator transcription factor [Nitrospira sp. SB0672_bin_25]|nr:response regulator transcription factor [Nitrospira sp. SB0666_bin_27]MYF23742.1 response regulator transcription factor [Nitrospira sp. SB0678_bin_10]MYJ54602.1 response regulator transcription factor [Nitrospira sp. SB0672_bin_25]
MTMTLRVIVADDERPAREFLTTMLRSFEDVEIVGEAKSGKETMRLIEQTQPDLAFLDLQMPEMDGLSIVRSLRQGRIPLVAFVTAFEEHAVSAFEVEALDYLLKPVDRGRLRTTIDRAYERLERASVAEQELFDSASFGYAQDRRDRPSTPAFRELPALEGQYIDRFPIRKHDDIYLLPVHRIASAVSEGELMHVTTIDKERYTMNYRLKTLEAKLDPKRFLRVGRGALVNVETIRKITPMPGGSYLLTLTNTQQLRVSRSQSRALRSHLLQV